MILSYTIRIYPNESQKQIIKNNFDSCRFVYNYFLKYSIKNKNYNLKNWKDHLAKMKEDTKYSFLNSADEIALFNSLTDLNRAIIIYNKGLKKSPKEKNKWHRIYRTSNGASKILLYKKYVEIPGIGKIKCRHSKNYRVWDVLFAVIKQPIENVYEAVLCFFKKSINKRKTNKEIGIDLGVRKLITTSENKKYVDTSNFLLIEKRIKEKQSDLSKKQYNSKNYLKLKKDISVLYRHEALIMKDLIDKATTNLVEKYDVIYMEDLDINDLIETQTSKFIRKKLLYSSLGRIREKLEYKCKLYGKKLVFVDKFFPSSKKCSFCGKENDIGKEEIFCCKFCGKTIDRDYNAANNILVEGRRIVEKYKSTIDGIGI